MQRDEHTHLCLLEQHTLNVDRYRMSESLRECTLPVEGFRIDDTMKKPPKKLDATAKDAKKKKKSEKKDSKEKSKKEGNRAKPDSMLGREVSWSRSYLESTDELPFQDDLVKSAKTLQRHQRRPKSNGETHTNGLMQEIVLEESGEMTLDDLERAAKDAAVVVIDMNGFPLDESASSLNLWDLMDQDEQHSNNMHNFEDSYTSTKSSCTESHLRTSFASVEKSLTLSHLQDSLTSIHLQDSNTTTEKSLTMSHLQGSRTSNDNVCMQSNLQDSAKYSGGLEQDASVAITTAAAFETFLRRQHGLQKTSSNGSMDSFALGHREDDSSSDGDWDDPFRESKFWGSESTLLIGDDDDVKSFQEDNDAWASFGRVRRNEAFVKRVSSKDMVSTHSTQSTKSMDRTLSSPDRSGKDGTPNHKNPTAFHSSIRSLDALIPRERTVEQQLASLSLSQRACVCKLKSHWEEYDGGKHVFPDDWYLRVARCSPGDPFTFKSAWKVLERFECNYFDLQISKMEKSVLTKIAFPVPGLKTKGGRDVFYMKPGRYFPRETPTETFIDLLVYTMNCMLEKEHDNVHGLGLVANMTGWKMENFSVPYWHKFLMTLQGYRVPTRISLFLIVNPPYWFGSIWKIMKPMMSKDFQKKVAVIGFDKLDRYLMDGCRRHLPDDLEGGKLNTDTVVKAFIAERKAIESKPL